jgi:hypothetical protein
MCWSFLPHVRFLILLTVFELLPKTCNFTICSIFSNSGHVGWCTASPDTILKLDTLVMIQTKFGFHWSSTFRGEDFWKSLRRTTDDDDGRQVMAIAHMTLWVRWAKKGALNSQPQVINLLAHGRWFSPGTTTSFTTKTGCHDIAEILLKVVLNTKNQIILWYVQVCVVFLHNNCSVRN